LIMPRPRTSSPAAQTELPLTSAAEPALEVSTLRPGVLVGLKTSVTGNASYTKETIEPEHKVRSGALRAVWKTERTITDPEEHGKANQARMKARAIVASVCAKSAFGLLCPESNLDKLSLAMKEARRVVDRFNQTSRLTRVAVYIITGRVAQNDVEAVRAIKSEVRDLLASMSEGIKNLDVKTVREAANKARNLGAMLSPTAAGQVKAAIEAARGAARKIAKAGEEVAQEVDREALNALNAARTAFLDVIEEGEQTEMEAPAAEALAVDIDPEAEVPVSEPALSARPRRVRSVAKKPAAKAKSRKKAVKSPAKKSTRRRPAAEARAT
jgi:hypothetical protein